MSDMSITGTHAAVPAVSRLQRVSLRLRRAWGEIEHAQRRMFELRTGVPAGPPRRRDAHAEIVRLEELYARAEAEEPPAAA